MVCIEVAGGSRVNGLNMRHQVKAAWVCCGYGYGWRDVHGSILEMQSISVYLVFRNVRDVRILAVPSAPLASALSSLTRVRAKLRLLQRTSILYSSAVVKNIG